MPLLCSIYSNLLLLVLDIIPFSKDSTCELNRRIRNFFYGTFTHVQPTFFAKDKEQITLGVVGHVL